MNGRIFFVFIFTALVSSQSENILDLLTKDYVLCIGGENETTYLSPIGSCNYKSWISNNDCGSCLEKNASFCFDNKTRKSYCISSNVSCDIGYENVDNIIQCPCSHPSLIGPNCTFPACGTGGIFDPYLLKCKCKKGWTGEKCDKCEMKNSNNQQYLCCKYTTDWIMVSPTEESFHRYLTGSYSLLPCLFPNTTLRDGSKLGCDCNILALHSTLLSSIPHRNNRTFTNGIKSYEQYVSIQIGKELDNAGESSERIARYLAEVVDGETYSPSKKKSNSVNSSLPSGDNTDGLIVFSLAVSITVIALVLIILYFACFVYTKKSNIFDQVSEARRMSKNKKEVTYSERANSKKIKNPSQSQRNGVFKL
jgi:hypothetical protein